MLRFLRFSNKFTIKYSGWGDVGHVWLLEFHIYSAIHQTRSGCFPNSIGRASWRPNKKVTNLFQSRHVEIDLAVGNKLANHKTCRTCWTTYELVRQLVVSSGWPTSCRTN